MTMMTFWAPKPTDMPLDAWTDQRRQRQRLLKHCGGDAEKAWPIWWKYTRELFAKWLHDTGVLDEWSVDDD